MKKNNARFYIIICLKKTHNTNDILRIYIHSPKEYYIFFVFLKRKIIIDKIFCFR